MKRYDYKFISFSAFVLLKNNVKYLVWTHIVWYSFLLLYRPGSTMHLFLVLSCSAVSVVCVNVENFIKLIRDLRGAPSHFVGMFWVFKRTCLHLCSMHSINQAHYILIQWNQIEKTYYYLNWKSLTWIFVI